MTSLLRRFSACDHGVTRHLNEAALRAVQKLTETSIIALTSLQIESSKNSNAERI
jgi:hypothetical protein